MNPTSQQSQSLSQYGKLLADLAKAGVDYAVVGGLAVIFNGYPRFTLDADIIVGDSKENLERLLASLRHWGEGWAKELSIEDFPAEEGAIRVVEDFELDIFTRLRGRSLEDFRDDLRSLVFHDVKIAFLSPAGLLHCKESSVREKDILDTAAMRAVMEREQSDR